MVGRRRRGPAVIDTAPGTAAAAHLGRPTSGVSGPAVAVRRRRRKDSLPAPTRRALVPGNSPHHVHNEGLAA
jgi:hypothetical protein